MTDPAAEHPFDRGLHLEGGADMQFTLSTEEAYWNQVGPFGGWLLAAGLKAIMASSGGRGEPIEAHARFMRAPKAEPLIIQVTCQNQGRSVGFWRAALGQGAPGRPALTEVSAILSDARPGADLIVSRMPEVPDAATLRESRPSGTTVRWLERFRFRWVMGLPFAALPADPGRAILHSRVWTRTAEPRALDWLGLAAFADIAIPRPFLRQPRPSPVATIAMSTYFHVTGAELAALPDQWLLLDITTHGMRRGYFDHAVDIWSESGQLLLSTTQIAWFAEPVRDAPN